MDILYENQWIYIEQEIAEIPWLKIFAKQGVKEFSECNIETQEEIFRVLLILEREMIRFFKPDKMNIASFANYLPKVHWHIMARFKNDSHFPEPMWGVKQRDSSLNIPNISQFMNSLDTII